MTDGPSQSLTPGDVIWVEPGITVGREQAERRPALVVAGIGYLEIADTLAIVVPITTIGRGWPNHIQVFGADLPTPSWAMSEQVRAISRDRIVGGAGCADGLTLAAVRTWLADFLDL